MGSWISQMIEWGQKGTKRCILYSGAIRFGWEKSRSRITFEQLLIYYLNRTLLRLVRSSYEGYNNVCICIDLPTSISSERRLLKTKLTLFYLFSFSRIRCYHFKFLRIDSLGTRVCWLWRSERECTIFDWNRSCHGRMGITSSSRSISFIRVSFRVFSFSFFLSFLMKARQRLLITSSLLTVKPFLSWECGFVIKS